MTAAAALPKPLVSTHWLAAHLGEPDLVVIDASWRMPRARTRAIENTPVGARGNLALSAFADGGNGDARNDYLKRHIPGAVFFPIDHIAQAGTDLPHMLAPAGIFERAVGAMGVDNASRVVIYDDQGLFSAPRVWWNFIAMGHRDVAVLDGGLPKWIDEERPVSADVPIIAPRRFKASPEPGRVADHEYVRASLRSDALVLDARPAGRFKGADPEPRAGLRCGHMPGSISLPFSNLIADNGCLKPPDELRRSFEAAGLSPTRQVITSCGSGVSAAILILAVETLGHRRHALYDGSWAEWGLESADPREFPVEAGEG